MNSVFADLNRGSTVTANLRKVDQSEMTHKNPTLRESSVVPEVKSSMPSKAKSNTVKVLSEKKKPARMELEGTKWIIENFENDSAILLDKVELNHTIYVYNCFDCTIQIKGKFNALSLDSCKKTGVVVDSLVSSIDLVKSSSFAVQILNSCPTVICDTCDSGQIYLSRSALDCELITTKCGSINVNFELQDSEFQEQALPEMLKHTISDGKLETSLVIHAD